MRKLDVFYNDIKAGELEENLPGKGYSFTYEDSYRKSPFPPVAFQFPKSKKEYTSDHLFPFFCNILPEGSLKELVCRQYKIDEEDDFGLLCAMADADFIGAIEVRTPRNQ